MKNFFLAFALLFTSLAISQDGASVRGQITDMESFGEPLLYANVKVKGAEAQTQTNLRGNFEFDEIAPGKYT
ncbi:MAG: carboxypeptidase-like regulatory domain-containing protein, partial [Flavobacteriaceae bacterium]